VFRLQLKNMGLTGKQGLLTKQENGIAISCIFNKYSLPFKHLPHCGYYFCFFLFIKYNFTIFDSKLENKRRNEMIFSRSHATMRSFFNYFHQNKSLIKQNIYIYRLEFKKQQQQTNKNI